MVNTTDNIDFTGLDELFLMEKSWRYHNWLYEMSNGYIKGNCLEIGAGIGSFTQRWLNIATHVTAVELAQNCCEHLGRRFPGNEELEIICEDFFKIDFSDKKFDAIISFNVFEHIDDDISCFKKIRSLLNDSGHFIMYVPACKVLYSEIDRKVGHIRRYTKKEIINKFDQAGLTPVKLHYVNICGFFGYLLNYRLLKRQMSQGNVSLFDNIIVPISKFAENFVKFPFGQSIFVVAKRQ